MLFINHDGHDECYPVIKVISWKKLIIVKKLSHYKMHKNQIVKEVKKELWLVAMFITKLIIKNDPELFETQTKEMTVREILLWGALSVICSSEFNFCWIYVNVYKKVL